MSQHNPDWLEEHRPIPWRELAAAATRHWRIVAGVAGLGVVVAALLSVVPGPSFRATAKLMVTSERARITVSPDPKAGPMIDTVTEQDLNAEVALLNSAALVREVLEVHQESIIAPGETGRGLVTPLFNPASIPSAAYRWLHGIAPQPALETWVRSTLAYLTVNVIRGSNLIEISYEGAAPAWTAQLVNDLIARHVERHALLYQQSEARRFIESQRALLSDKQHAAEDARRAFYEREGLESVPEQRSRLRSKVDELEAALANAETELVEGAARADFLSKGIHAHAPTLPLATGATQGSPDQLIRTRILELELQRSQLLSQYAPTSTRIQDVDRQIGEARRLLHGHKHAAGGGVSNPTHQALAVDLTQTRAHMAAVKARAASLRDQVAQYRAQLEHLDRVSSEAERLEQEVTTAKEAFLTYSKKEEEARFATALDESRIVNVSVVEYADVPTAPLPSRAALRFLLGAFLSVLLGLAAGYVRDRMDPSVKSAAETQQLTGLRILADIPS